MAINAVIDRTLDTFVCKWAENAIKNGQRQDTHDLGDIQAKLDVDMVIVCGTGPSLNADMGRLFEISKEEKNTAIIANHSNLATLLFRGIAPDYVVITDSQEPTFLRLQRDVLPHFKAMLKKKHTAFILPTHANIELVNLLTAHKMPVYFFLAAIRQEQDNLFSRLYNTVLSVSGGTGFKTFIMQAGSVSNAAVLVCQALKMLDKLPNLKNVVLSGVDYSYPNGWTRCEQVTWNAETRDFDINGWPEFLGPEIRRVRYNGLETSEEQVEYMKDLRFIYWNMIEANKAKNEQPFDLWTSSDNFIHDFLPIWKL